MILPQGADQFHNARRLADVGAGRALLNDQQLPGAIARAVTEMLAGSSERQVAIRLRDEIGALPMPAEVVPELVALVGIRRVTVDSGHIVTSLVTPTISVELSAWA